MICLIAVLVRRPPLSISSVLSPGAGLTDPRPCGSQAKGPTGEGGGGEGGGGEGGGGEGKVSMESINMGAASILELGTKFVHFSN